MRPKNEDVVLKIRTGPYKGGSRRETARWKAIAYSYLAHYFVLDPTQRIGLRYDETGWICTARSFGQKTPHVILRKGKKPFSTPERSRQIASDTVLCFS